MNSQLHPSFQVTQPQWQFTFNRVRTNLRVLRSSDCCSNQWVRTALVKWRVQVFQELPDSSEVFWSRCHEMRGVSDITTRASWVVMNPILHPFGPIVRRAVYFLTPKRINGKSHVRNDVPICRVLTSANDLLCSWLMEGCHVWQPTLDLRWTGETGSSYLHCMEVGTISYYKNKGIRNCYTFVAWK